MKVCPMKGLKAKRAANGYSQKDMAEKLGITLSAYQNYEHGYRKPLFEVAMKLEVIFKCKLIDLI